MQSVSSNSQPIIKVKTSISDRPKNQYHNQWGKWPITGTQKGGSINLQGAEDSHESLWVKTQNHTGVRRYILEERESRQMCLDWKHFPVLSFILNQVTKSTFVFRWFQQPED